MNVTNSAVAAVLIAWLVTAPIAVAASGNEPSSASVRREDVEVVDCLLPPQVRTLGVRVFQTPRRPTRTSVTECRVRGGEWVSYDRANLDTALKVWLETAQAGDAEAQTTVGEIYEKGLGVPPDFGKAAAWYQRAASQGYSRALFNLGTLYEQGLGVEQDKLKALNLYREAGGLKGDDLLFERSALEEQERQRSSLQQLIDELSLQIETLEKQVGQLEQELSQQQSASSRSASEVATLRKLVAGLQAERVKSSERLAALPPSRTREPGANAPDIEAGPAATPRELAGMKLGRFYALVIGNQNYQKIEPLQTPLNDARRAAQVLKSKYGFAVTVINDADDVAMLEALNRLNSVLKAEDNLLIYYAGHGSRFAGHARNAGYWLPVNSDPPPKDTFWVQNEQITAHLARLPARRVLVVADSCYAGLLSDDPSLLVLTKPDQVSLAYVRYKLPNRARLLIASGGDQPVLDAGGQGNSVFARAFLDVLDANQGVLSAPSLFVQLQDRVKQAAARAEFHQVPEFKVIKGAGHGIGDFFFVPVAGR